MQYNKVLKVRNTCIALRTKFYIISIVIFLCSFFGCKAENPIVGSEAKITVQLKSKEQIGFTYWDDHFNPQMIKFSNPSDHDTSITKKIFLKNPVIFTWQFLITKSDKKTRYSFLVKPNDDLHIGTSFPNIYPINDFAFLVDSTDIFFTTNYYSTLTGNKPNDNEREKRNKIFLDNLEKGYNDVLEKISRDYKLGHFDTSILKNKRWLAASEYYGILFTVTEETSPFNKVLKAKITADRKNIDALIEQKPPATWSLIRTLMGIREIDIKRTGTKSANFWEMYYSVIKEPNAGFKMPLLLYMLNTPLRQNDIEFTEALRAFNELYPDKKNLTDSILLAKTPILNSESSDSFLAIDGEPYKWKDIINVNSGKIVVVDVWASWCVPCRALFPAFDSVKTILGNEAFHFVTINIDEEKSDWEIVSKSEKHFLKQNNFYLVKAQQSYFVKALKIESIPRIIVLKNGKVLNADFYPPTDKSFVKQLRLYFNGH